MTIINRIAVLIAALALLTTGIIDPNGMEGLQLIGLSLILSLLGIYL